MVVLKLLYQGNLLIHYSLFLKKFLKIIKVMLIIFTIYVKD
jgi:hypothetical protein